VLYLDSSALIKHYQRERGTDTIDARLRAEAQNVRSAFTSVLTYAEMHAVLARRAREKLLSPAQVVALQDRFDADWVFEISPIELGTNVLVFVRNIVRDFPLKGADAVHLASALWLRDMTRLGIKPDQYAGPIVFASSDRQLVSAARKHQLEVFNPETAK
jgi:predicted nucleic acid-binding protein